MTLSYTLPLSEAQKAEIHRRARREQGEAVVAAFAALARRIAAIARHLTASTPRALIGSRPAGLVG